MRSPTTALRSPKALVLLAAGALLSLAAVVLPNSASANSPAANACSLSSQMVPSCGVLWGVYKPESSGETWATDTTDLEAQLGRPLDIVYRYHDFSTSGSGAFPDASEQALAASGHVLLDDWAPKIFSTGVKLQWGDIAAGNYDASVIDPEAQRIKAYGKPIMLSFDHEMDARVGVTGTAAQYVAAYQHIENQFNALGVTNVIWVWTTTGYSGRYSMFNSLYPGNAYVDWIGYDPYNFGTCQNSGGATKTFQQTVDPMYQWLESNGYGDKPFILPEYGTVPNPSDSSAAAAWYNSVPSVLATHPNLKALVQWDDSVGNCNTTLSQPGELAAFTQAGLSATVRGAAVPTTPLTPTVTSASTTTTNVSWPAVSGATSYQVERAANGTNNYSNVGSPVTGTSLTDSGLTPGGTYSYEVVAINASGSSSASSAAAVTLLPGKPGTLTASTTGTTQVTLNWGAATGAASYEVLAGAAGSGTFSTDLGTVSGTSFTDSGLTPGASYDYEVVPSDSSGAGAASNTATGQTVPAQVIGLNAKVISAGEVDLSWSAASGANSYLVERSPSGAGNWSIISSGTNALSFADTTVNQATAYDYRLAAVGSAGQGAFSALQTVTTPQVKPGQVTGVSASAASPTEIDLTWTSTANANTYTVLRSSTSATAGFTALSSSVAPAWYQDTTVSPNTTYWYEVIANNTAGSGPASVGTVGATPPVNSALLTNGFEGATIGGSMTAASSGGASGNALNLVSCATGLATYTSASAAHGKISGLLTPTTKICYAEWNSKSITPTPVAYGRAYVKLAADPSGQFGLLKVSNAAFGRDVQVNLSKTGKLSILDATGATQLTFASAIPLNQWVRLEWYTAAATSGTFELRMYAGDSTTPLESHVVTGINTGTSVAVMQAGMLSGVAAGLGTTIGLDSLAYGTTTWLGPATS
jgi:fibronectin type 3 domain-containing protein